MARKNVTVICDLGFGSSGKGLISGYMAKKECPDVVCTAWGMNAGHTYIDEHDRKFVHCMLANGVVSPNLKYVLIGPGSSIGVEKLVEEVKSCQDLLKGVMVLIHPNATIIQQRHIDEESGPMTKIGSTKKGCGAALIEKIRRNPNNRITAKQLEDILTYMFRGYDIEVCNNGDYMDIIHGAEKILVEGSQGYSLGINSGLYPYTTSRECSPAQIISDSLIPIGKVKKIIGTMRTYPIRVANRFDEKGKMVGWSGPCYSDQMELSFDDINQEVEFTTVTKLPRRVFSFSHEQCTMALQTCMPDEVFLNFANYCSDEENDATIGYINDVCDELECGEVKYIGYGATHGDIVEV